MSTVREPSSDTWEAHPEAEAWGRPPAPASDHLHPSQERILLAVTQLCHGLSPP